MTDAAARSRLGRPVIRSALYALAGVAVLCAPGIPADDAGRRIGVVAGAVLCALAGLALLLGLRPARPGAGDRAGRGRSDGPHRIDFTPLALLGRSPLDPVACAALLASAIAYADPGQQAVPVSLSVIGVLLGYHLWRRRSPNAWWQLALSVFLPLAVTALLLGVATTPDDRYVLLASLLPATGLGSSLGAIAERASGRRGPKRLRAAWRGVASVRSTAGEVAVEFDVRPLLRPVSRSEARRVAGGAPDGLRRRMLLFKTLFLVGAPLIALLIPIAFTDEDYVAGSDAPRQIAGMAAFFSLLILGYGILGVIGSRGWRQVTSAADHLRLARFAAANGFRYTPGPVSDERGNELTRRLRAEHGWEIANAVKVAQQPRDSVAPVTQFSGFGEFRLPAALPHLLLVRRGFRAPTFSAFSAPDRGQRMKLEGDFNRYFDVYCPRGYERDALYLLTPDVMAALIDGAREFDVEIIDDRLILRSREDLVTTDPGVWLTLADAVSALAGRTRQWRRWRDDRREPPESAAPRLLAERPGGAALAGRRLRGGASLGLLLAVGFGVVYGALVWLATAL
ncbi:hypothetical protein JD276_11780 [Leucobacter sp. CSA1]|uniref:Uncharacterized protein n=1 Tax=Leucobacter chromiisoli TaxID=2796471 RepID=A0A934Q7J7_9MICO|nr:hypothetical protein [Leucobacter chromiisoli]MBK0419714.1 hypothetical protein [Leucobacter chromiisoli]